MYPNPLVNNSLSLTRVLNGISKTISVANQVIPIYKQAKPLLSNFSSVTKLLKSITKDEPVKNKVIEKEEPKIEDNKINSPTFFQ